MNQPTTTPVTLDLNWVRSQFPGLSDDFILMDNAGGSQACVQVIDRIREYFHSYNVQLGASYRHSYLAGKHFEHIHQELASMVQASRPEEIICGPSTTALLRIMSICLSRNWNEGDEVIVTNSDHEANVSCWMDLKDKGIRVKIWKLNMDTLQFELEDLKALITDKTRLVAMVHASNLLGTINPIKEISKIVHDAGALFCVDGVAYAPHRQIKVQDWNVDIYVFSTYKTYGPHQAIMYARYEIIKDLRGLNHYFIQSSPYKFQPGNFNFELTYSMLGIKQYFERLGAHHFPELRDSSMMIEKGFKLIASHEESLSTVFINFLNTVKNIRILGHNSGDKKERVPTFSFIHHRLGSKDIVDQVDPHDIGIRHGDFYAKKLVQDLGLDEHDGVVRISMVHYNSSDQVQKLITVLQKII